MTGPGELWAIDWGAKPEKRQRCRAVLRGGRYAIEKPAPVTVEELRALPDGVLAAFDCSFGLSKAYAEAAGIPSFREGLRRFGGPGFERFYEPATTPEEIDLARPFYPAGTKGTRDEHDAQLGREPSRALRRCDELSGAGPLFWLVGPKQVGRSAITVWRDVLGPQLERVSLWPHDGPLKTLLAAKKPVVAEAYPGWYQRFWLGMPHHGKRKVEDRREMGAALVERAKGIDIAAVRTMLLDGFGDGPQGEDAFDAVLSAIALVDLLQRGIPEPDDDARRVEGWILGV